MSPDPVLAKWSSNTFISLGMYLKQLTAVWIINSRLDARGHVIYVVALIAIPVKAIHAVLVLVVNAVVV